MNLRFIDWIWNIRGSLALAPGQSGDAVFDRLDPLFRERDTSYDRSHDTLIFRKSNQAPQDKMAIFDRGVLRIEQEPGGPVLRYRLSSRALLYCFLAPLLFLAFAQLNVAIGMIDKPSAEEKAAAKKKKEEEEKKLAERELHPIDQFLGAPAPKKPEKDKQDKSGEEEKEDNNHSPTPGYVFAAIFAVLYVAGRILESWRIRSNFRRKLQESPGPSDTERIGPAESQHAG